MLVLILRLRHSDLSFICFSVIANSHHTLTVVEQSLSSEIPLLIEGFCLGMQRARTSVRKFSANGSEFGFGLGGRWVWVRLGLARWVWVRFRLGSGTSSDCDSYMNKPIYSDLYINHLIFSILRGYLSISSIASKTVKPLNAVLKRIMIKFTSNSNWVC